MYPCKLFYKKNYCIHESVINYFTVFKIPTSFLDGGQT